MRHAKAGHTRRLAIGEQDAIVFRVIFIQSSCPRYAHDLSRAFLILFQVGSLIIIAGFIAESRYP
jgi:hypothetical protein